MGREGQESTPSQRSLFGAKPGGKVSTNTWPVDGALLAAVILTRTYMSTLSVFPTTLRVMSGPALLASATVNLRQKASAGHPSSVPKATAPVEVTFTAFAQSTVRFVSYSVPVIAKQTYARHLRGPRKTWERCWTP